MIKQKDERNNDKKECIITKKKEEEKKKKEEKENSMKMPVPVVRDGRRSNSQGQYLMDPSMEEVMTFLRNSRDTFFRLLERAEDPSSSSK